MSKRKAHTPLSSLHGEFGEVLRTLRKQHDLGQSFLAEELNVSVPTVSRMENGYLPLRSDLEAIAEALRLTDSERHVLESAWHRGVLEDEKLTSSLVIGGRGLPFIKTKLENSIELTRELRRDGQPHLASRIAERDADEAFVMLEGQVWSEKESPPAVELLVELHLEAVKCGLDYLPRAEVRNGRLDSLLERQSDAVEASGRQRSRILGLLTREGVEWLSDNRATAHQIGLELIGTLSDVPERWTAEVLRASAINAGAVGDAELIKRVKQHVETWRGTAPTSSEEVFVLEGFARGSGAFHLDAGLGVLDEAWSKREETAGTPGHSPLRFVQLARTEAEMYDHSRVPIEGDALRRLEEAHKMATANDYTRYVGVIEELLAKQ